MSLNDVKVKIKVKYNAKKDRIAIWDSLGKQWRISPMKREVQA